jgi:hypothetical protein
MTHDASAATPGIGHSERIGFDNRPEALAATRAAVGLAMTSPVAWSMTPRQLAVFRQLCLLQMHDAGAHSLLPNVVSGLLAVARRPWWDRGVAGLPDEPVDEGAG